VFFSEHSVVIQFMYYFLNVECVSVTSYFSEFTDGAQFAK